MAKRATDLSGHPTGHQRTQKALNFALPTIFVATAQGNATSLITAQSIVRMDGYAMQPQTSIRHSPVQTLDSLLRLVPPVQKRSSSIQESSQVPPALKRKHISPRAPIF